MDEVAVSGHSEHESTTISTYNPSASFGCGGGACSLLSAAKEGMLELKPGFAAGGGLGFTIGGGLGVGTNGGGASTSETYRRDDNTSGAKDTGTQEHKRDSEQGRSTSKGSNVTVFSTATCCHCKKAKALLREKHIFFRDVAVDAVDFPRESMKELIALSGKCGIPQVFFGDRFVGGLPELQQLADDGTLVEQAGAACELCFSFHFHVHFCLLLLPLLFSFSFFLTPFLHTGPPLHPLLARWTLPLHDDENGLSRERLDCAGLAAKKKGICAELEQEKERLQSRSKSGSSRGSHLAAALSIAAAGASSSTASSPPFFSSPSSPPLTLRFGLPEDKFFQPIAAIATADTSISPADVPTTATGVEDGIPICEVSRALSRGLSSSTRDRPYLLTTYRNCFLGCDLVSLLLRDFPSLGGDRAAAVRAGRELQRLGLLDHVCGDQLVEDSGSYFYRLLQDNHPAVLNMVFPWAKAKGRGEEKWDEDGQVRGNGGERKAAAERAACLVHDMTVLLATAKRARTDPSTGLCDYDAVGADAAFERFEDLSCALQTVSLDAMGDRERCCFLINVYNICIQHGYVQCGGGEVVEVKWCV